MIPDTYASRLQVECLCIHEVKADEVCADTGIDVRGGKAHVYSSYFAQRMTGRRIEQAAYALLRETGVSIELTNNYYLSGKLNKNEGEGKIYGTD